LTSAGTTKTARESVQIHTSYFFSPPTCPGLGLGRATGRHAEVSRTNPVGTRVLPTLTRAAKHGIVKEEYFLFRRFATIRLLDAS